MIPGPVLLLFATAIAGPTPLFGLEWRPLGRADLNWVDEGRTSGLAVAELDGAVRPALSAFFGAWMSERTALLGSLGLARMTTTTWTDGGEGEPDTYRSRSWGVFRPEVDLRFAPWGHRTNPTAFLIGGLYGDIPSARDVSNAYTEEEQATADETAAQDRIRLGGFGARLGFGADVDLGKGVHIGGQYTVYWQQTLLVSDDADAVSGWLASEASMILTIEFGRTTAADTP